MGLRVTSRHLSTMQDGEVAIVKAGDDASGVVRRAKRR